MAHQAGAPIEQIQQSLGHASIQTTERYLGVDLDLQNAPSDYIRLDVIHFDNIMVKLRDSCWGGEQIPVSA